jgi:hypothetical protein
MNPANHHGNRVLAPALVVAALLLTPVLQPARGQSSSGSPTPAVTQSAPFEYDGAPGSKFSILVTNGKATMITEEVAGQRILSNIANGHAQVLTVQQNGTVLWSMGQKGKEALVNAASARANAAVAFYLANPGIASSPQSAQTNAGSSVEASAAAPTPQAAPGSAQVGADEAIHFDEATHTITVPRPDGVVVTFVGRDIKIAGVRNLPIKYIIRYQKGSASRFLERANGTEAAVGGTLGGGGEEFLIDGGGIIYDSTMLAGDAQENPNVLLAKQLAQVAMYAVADVRQAPGHGNFEPPGYKSLKEVSQYRLRSDGSR